ncbi:hypothetical protein BDW68DRAFT_166809 [Aspergillus falconensis]
MPPQYFPSESEKLLLDSSMSTPHRHDRHGNETNIWHIHKQTLQALANLVDFHMMSDACSGLKLLISMALQLSLVPYPRLRRVSKAMHEINSFIFKGGNAPDRARFIRRNSLPPFMLSHASSRFRAVFVD